MHERHDARRPQLEQEPAHPATRRGLSCGASEDAGAIIECRLRALLIGDSRPMRALRSAVARAGASPLPVLVTGPTGAGKELVARALHLASRRPGPLVAFNVCAVADALFESAVFGHVRGAFTGAVADNAGYLAEADRGTAFLDEVGALPLAAQAKLLRAVELREFRPVGAGRDRRSDFRLISATNDDIEQLVDAGRFRADLAERLGGLVLDVPPLASRREDVPQLVAHFAAEYATAHTTAHAALRTASHFHIVDSRLSESPEPTGGTLGASTEFSPEALALLQAHAWPRNVRQLRHAVERALAWSPSGLVDADTVRAALPRPVPARGGMVVSATAPRRPPQAGTTSDGRAGDVGHCAAETAFQQRRLADVLRACSGDTARAAALLGVNRATVYRRMARLGIPAVARTESDLPT